jgi:hypothetical protein
MCSEARFFSVRLRPSALSTAAVRLRPSALSTAAMSCKYVHYTFQCCPLAHECSTASFKKAACSSWNSEDRFHIALVVYQWQSQLVFR